MAFRPALFAGPLLALSLVAAEAAWADAAQDGNAAFEKHDYPTAVKLLMPLALEGNLTAEMDIGLMYFSGNGFPRDRHEAAKWFLAAARQGNIGGQTDIGIVYVTGDGAPRDLVQAYMWFSLAADQEAGTDKTSAATYRDHVAGEMTADQLQSARDLAKQCRASNFRSCGTQ